MKGTLMKKETILLIFCIGIIISTLRIKIKNNAITIQFSIWPLLKDSLKNKK